MICEAGDIAVVPFPFTDSSVVKHRPALVLSTSVFNRSCGNTIMAMITTARHTRWPGDTPISPAASGLPKECLVRMKIFTLDNRLILRMATKLPPKDRQRVWSSLEETLGRKP